MKDWLKTIKDSHKPRECSCTYCPVHSSCLCNVFYSGDRPICPIPGHPITEIDYSYSVDQTNAWPKSW